MFTDTHCHLASFPQSDILQILNNAKLAGISRIVTLATCPEDFAINIALATQQEVPKVFVCLGIHPCEVHKVDFQSLDQLGQQIVDADVCAIGEAGLDYFHSPPHNFTVEKFREKQKFILRKQFELAKNNNLNIVIHTRDKEGRQSFNDAVKIYQEFAGYVRALFHCFTGNWTEAKRVIDLGGLISFGGVITFKNAQNMRECLCSCPSESFLLETDSPYLAPEPYRGKRNEPAYVRIIAEKIATLRNENLESLAINTEATANSFFRFCRKN